MKKIVFLLCCSLLVSCAVKNDTDKLTSEIDRIISTKDATFGIGIYNFKTRDTLFVNKIIQFAIMSVVKFPQALAVLDQVDNGKLDYNIKIHFDESDLRKDTFSPLRDTRDSTNFDISLEEALSYTISKSDNNVCDKLFKIIGGVNVAEDYIRQLGLKNISIGTDYANIQANTIYANSSTPEDMLELLRRFYNHELLSKKSTGILWKKMVETQTGPDRIRGLLPKGTIVGHKTGTSGTTENGITAACNDVGIINLPNGDSIAIVVFIADTKESDDSNAQTIAEIAKAAYDFFGGKN